MGAVDLNDLMIVHVDSIIHTRRWYSCSRSCRSNLSHIVLMPFREKNQLCHSSISKLCINFQKHIKTRVKLQNKGGQPPPGDTPLRLTLDIFQQYATHGKKTPPCRQCHVYKNTRRRESQRCETCDKCAGVSKRHENRFMSADCGVALAIFKVKNIFL